MVAIDKLTDALQSFPHFDLLHNLCSTKDAYLVGGAIRDALIDSPLSDLDLIFPEDPTSLAREFARQIGGYWFWLDRERLQSRVVVTHYGDYFNYDFALFRAPDLEHDLLDRDFTINTLALSLAGDLSAASLLDPCCGLAALQKSSLCMVTKDSFANDPLRIIKGVRHATALDLNVEPATLQAMQREIAGLDHVAAERVRQEIWKIISNEQAAQGLQLLNESGAGAQLFGEGFARSLTAMTECLAVCRHYWQRLINDEPVVGDWLAQEIEQGLSNETLLLSTFILSSIDSSLPTFLAEKWRLSRKSKGNITAIAALDKVTLNEFAAVAHNERAYSWWSAHCHIDPKLLLMTLAVGPPNVAPALPEIKAWVPLIAHLNDQRPHDLVDGHWLRSELGLNDGPEMTTALQLLRNAEISGQVSNEDEAQRFLVEYYRNKD